MSAGGGLRWWQEETPVPGAYTSPPLVAPAVVAEEANTEAADLWDELEAEAQSRAQAEAQGERVIIPFNSQLNMQRLRKRILLVSPFLLLVCGLVAFIYGPFLAVCLALVFVIEFAVMYRIMERATLRQTQPAVVLSRDGIEIHITGHDIGLIRWEEIADIRVYNFWPYRYVGIVPKDTPALCKRLGKKATLIRANEWHLRWLYRPLHIWCAPINIPQQNLPITADALLARIAAFETGQ